ncbi:MAG: (d)CMP kinase [Spirochaetales bacterium]|nr:(d)CMP kinase [Spirochaetales bacterium]
MIITIDGTSGSGKSTVSRKFAKKQNMSLLNTGSLYRKITLDCLISGIKIEDREAVISAAAHCDFEKKNEFHLNDEKISRLVPLIAQIPEVRKIVKDYQKELGTAGNIVIEGRDIGTVVFPEAPLKFYITASPETRARRKFEELKAKGIEEDYQMVLENIINRDRADEGRKISPLKIPDGAVVIDTSELTIEQVVGQMEEEVRELKAESGKRTDEVN